MGLSSGRSPKSLLARAWNAFDGLAEDTLWAGASDLYAAVAGLVSFLMLLRVLETTEYGAFFGLYGIVGPLGSLTFAGPGLALLQRHYRNRQPKNDILRSFLLLTLTVGLASSGLALALALVYIDLTPLELVLVIASELLASSTIFVCAWLVQIAAGFPAMTRVRMGAMTLKLISVLGLSAFGMLSIRNLAAAYLVSYSVYVVWLLLHHLPSVGYRIRFGAPTVETARSSAVFAVPMVASSIQIDGDKFVLNAFDQSADAGLYGPAFRLVLLGALPIRVVGQAAFHRFLPEEEGGAEQSLGKVLRLSALMFAIGLLLAAFFYIAEPILALIFTRGYQQSGSIVRWLLLLLPLLALSEIPLNGLLSMGRATERAGVYTVSSVFSVAMYLLLIPGRGWQGAVAATLTAEVFLVIAAWTSLLVFRHRAREEAAGHEASVTV